MQKYSKIYLYNTPKWGFFLVSHKKPPFGYFFCKDTTSQNSLQSYKYMIFYMFFFNVIVVPLYFSIRIQESHIRATAPSDGITYICPASIWHTPQSLCPTKRSSHCRRLPLLVAMGVFQRKDRYDSDEKQHHRKTEINRSCIALTTASDLELTCSFL